MPTTHRLLRPLVALAAALLLAQAANAGPPLICHPFVTDGSPSLPWTGAPGWRAPDRSYDVRRLTADTLALLGPDTPVVARMETMRRATIYASGSPTVAADLLHAVLARAQAPGPDPRVAARAWFDAGYLIESYRQQSEIDKVDMLAAYSRSGGNPKAAMLDGYALVEKAIEVTPSDAAAMQFAASLMTTDPVAARRHRDSAAAGAAPGSLLATNITSSWGH
jgi:hypothetical protein